MPLKTILSRLLPSSFSPISLSDGGTTLTSIKPAVLPEKILCCSDFLLARSRGDSLLNNSSVPGSFTSITEPEFCLEIPRWMGCGCLFADFVQFASTTFEGHLQDLGHVCDRWTSSGPQAWWYMHTEAAYHTSYLPNWQAHGFIIKK